jgi:hypothetical protein
LATAVARRQRQHGGRGSTATEAARGRRRWRWWRRGHGDGGGTAGEAEAGAGRGGVLFSRCCSFLCPSFFELAVCRIRTFNVGIRPTYLPMSSVRCGPSICNVGKSPHSSRGLDLGLL